MVAEERPLKAVTGAGERPEKPLRLCFADIEKYTDSFNDENFLGNFQFGKLYRGLIPSESGTPPKPVTVKIWEATTRYSYCAGDNPRRFMDEVLFPQCETFSHPGLMKLYGYHIESEWCAVIYDFKPHDTFSNLLHSDDFKWPERIKVALGLTRLLAFLHKRHPRGRPLMIRNFSASHILVDEDWNPKLCDLSMLSGGMFPDRTQI